MTTIETTDAHIFNTYARIPVVFVKGRGATLWDDQGRQYTDFLAGIAVCSLGHAHPGLAEVMADQARTLVHVSNLYYTQPQAELARKLVQLSFADKVFFCNSGAEANEAALKLARRYFKEKGEPDRFTVVAMDKSFHGRTMATLSATGQEKIQKGFAPLMEKFIHVPFNDFKGLENAVDPHVCAVMMEPIQGEGGVIPADPGYLKAVRDLCNDRGILLIFDEVQTGMGRCGTLFACQQYGISPDIMTLAKALGNGLPIGAMLATQEVAKGFSTGSHGSTFGGTPLVTRVAGEVVSLISDPAFLKEIREKGEYFREGLSRLKPGHPCIKEVRGKGLLIGMELTVEAGPLVEQCMKKGFIINAIQGNILRFAPPLVVTREEIDALITALDSVLD
ncbi:MAG: acetylornithine transaminase [Pseudomonadota bacterium]